MTQSHIQFAPLILERKTPAEELREIVKNAPYQAGRQTMELVEGVAARLETPDAPKRWDGVFPWVRRSYATDGPVVFFTETFSFYPETSQVLTDATELADDDEPYHDGVIITITAGDGTEDVKVLRGTADDRWLYLALGEHSVVLTDPYGDAVGEAKDRWPKHCEPLPPGTITRITINNTLPTTEQRYSVEVMEPEKRPEPKEWRVSDKHRLVYLPGRGVDVLTNTGQLLVGIEEEDIQYWCDGLNSLRANLDPQEQPATEVAAEGLPLEFHCASGMEERLLVTPTASGSDGHLDLLCKRHGKEVFEFYLHPYDEARLRNLLNQRAAEVKR